MPATSVLSSRGVAAVQRQLDDALGVDDFAEGRRRDVDGGGFAGDRDGLGEVAELEREVHREVLVRLQHHVVCADVRKPVSSAVMS